MAGFRTLSSRYRILPDLRIGWTSANWDRFARENGAAELADGAVLGRSLWEFIEGAETRAVYEPLLFRVREEGGVVHVPFRCDSPGVRRFMELRMVRPEDGVVEIIAELLREEARPSVALLDSGQPRAGEPVPICSFCKRVESSTEHWVEAEAAQSELGLDEGTPPPPLVQTVCPACQAALKHRHD